MAECPFCGHDPYHYVDIGVGYEAVAVTCCELGIELFDHRRTGDVVLQREEFQEIADQLREKRQRVDAMHDALQEAIDVFEGMSDDEIEVELLPRLRAAVSTPLEPK